MNVEQVTNSLRQNLTIRVVIAALLTPLIIFTLSAAFKGIAPIFYRGVELLIYYGVAFLCVLPFFLYAIKHKASLWFYVFVSFTMVFLLVFLQAVMEPLNKSELIFR